VVAGSRQEKINTDSQQKDKEHNSPKVKEHSPGEELEGKLSHSEKLDKLPHSILENDKDIIEEGTLLSESINQGLQSFTPDLLFDNLVNNYKQAEQMYGERLIRALTGYDPSYIERNIRIPEFRRELQNDLRESIQSLKEKGFLDKEGAMTDLGLTVASIALVSEELEKLNRKGVLGERANKSKALEGLRADYALFRDHRFKDVNIKATIKKAIRRNHAEIVKEDLVVDEREAKERATIIYAIDASGSMKGKKIAAAKRAGIALSFNATRKKDKVGIIIFGKEVISEQPPTLSFRDLMRTIVQARAAKETDIAATITCARKSFHDTTGIKHLVLLTDGLQTVGSNPEKRVLEAVSAAAQERISISVIGLGLDEQGTTLSQKIVEVGKGHLYLVKDYEHLDVLIIEDYYAMKR
jgi:Mg-chelatase subunit ChlD